MTLCLMIDLEGAFDAVWHQGLIFLMSQAGLSGNFLKTIWNYLIERTFICKVNSIKKICTNSNTGVGQGSNCAALLFIFYIREMMNNNISKYIKYADDGTIYITGKNIKIMEELIQEDLQNINKWCEKWRMPINIKKTKVIVFRRNTSLPSINIKCRSKDSDGTINIVKIVQSREQKILGIILDESLNFESHLQLIIRNAYNSMNKFNDLINNNLGIPTQMAVMLYKTLVRTIIESSYMCWCTINENSLNN